MTHPVTGLRVPGRAPSHLHIPSWIDL